MKVKALTMCFLGGARRRPGDVFDYAGKEVPKSCKLVSREAPAPPAADPNEALTNAELRNKLADLGHKVAPQTQRAKLLALLAESEGRK